MNIRRFISARTWRRRSLLALVSVSAFLAITTLAWLSLLGTDDGHPVATQADASGWGHEALENIRHSAAALSPIADANACGMGASSCFKCHNGARAAAPKMDKKSGPWHADHKSVNGSCVGCHKGNERLIKKELSHEGMIVDSRRRADTCEACHKTGNTAELVQRYQRP